LPGPRTVASPAAGAEAGTSTIAAATTEDRVADKVVLVSTEGDLAVIEQATAKALAGRASRTTVPSVPVPPEALGLQPEV
jgi:hypothetical protein